MLRHVEREAGLADGRAGGEDDQVRLLKSRGHRVQGREPGADAADLALVLVEVVEPVIRRVEQRPQRREARRDALLTDGEELLLRLVDADLDVLRFVVADARPLAAEMRPRSTALRSTMRA